LNTIFMSRNIIMTECHSMLREMVRLFGNNLVIDWVILPTILPLCEDGNSCKYMKTNTCRNFHQDTLKEVYHRMWHTDSKVCRQLIMEMYYDDKYPWLRYNELTGNAHDMITYESFADTWIPMQSLYRIIYPMYYDKRLMVSSYAFSLKQYRFLKKQVIDVLNEWYENLYVRACTWKHQAHHPKQHIGCLHCGDNVFGCIKCIDNSGCCKSCAFITSNREQIEFIIKNV
jgi:hypothetical protein